MTTIPNVLADCHQAHGHQADGHKVAGHQADKQLAAAGAVVFEPFINKPEVARRLGKRVRTVDNWMEQGLLPYYKIGRSVSFKWSEVEVHLKELCRVSRGNQLRVER